MSDTTQRDSTSLASRINSTLARFRTPLLVVGVVLIVAIVVSVVAAQVLDARNQSAAREAEELTQDFDDWVAALPSRTGAGEREIGDELLATADELRERSTEIASEYRGTYGAQRALKVLGDLEWEVGSFEAARSAWVSLADSFDESYLAPIALMNAAAAAEQMGEAADAAALYLRVTESQAVGNAETPRAIFNLGRLAEEAGDAARALEWYNRLVDEQPASTWTNLARNRIILLTVEGVGSGG